MSCIFGLTCDTNRSMEKPEGFTLIELLIVVAIILILSMVVFINLFGQAARAKDIKRKTDLYALSKSFEDYKNDHEGYPDQSVVNSCGSADMAPYIAKIPCDPVSKRPYGYFPSANGGYRLCATLSDTTDPVIAAAGCGGPLGCGVGGGYNYCMGSGVTASAVGTVDQIVGGGGGGGGGGSPATTTTPNLNPLYHEACTIGGECNWFDNPGSAQHRCPYSWKDTCPQGFCEDITHRCAD